MVSYGRLGRRSKCSLYSIAPSCGSASNFVTLFSGFSAGRNHGDETLVGSVSNVNTDIVEEDEVYPVIWTPRQVHKAKDNKGRALRQVWRCDWQQQRVIFGTRSYVTTAHRGQPSPAALSSSRSLGLITKRFDDCSRLDPRLLRIPRCSGAN